MLVEHPGEPLERFARMKDGELRKSGSSPL